MPRFELGFNDRNIFVHMGEDVGDIQMSRLPGLTEEENTIIAAAHGISKIAKVHHPDRRVTEIWTAPEWVDEDLLALIRAGIERLKLPALMDVVDAFTRGQAEGEARAKRALNPIINWVALKDEVPTSDIIVLLCGPSGTSRYLARIELGYTPNLPRMQGDDSPIPWLDLYDVAMNSPGWPTHWAPAPTMTLPDFGPETAGLGKHGSAQFGLPGSIVRDLGIGTGDEVEAVKGEDGRWYLQKAAPVKRYYLRFAGGERREVTQKRYYTVRDDHRGILPPSQITGEIQHFEAPGVEGWMEGA